MASCWAGSVERWPAAHQATTSGGQVLGHGGLGQGDDAVEQHRYAGPGRGDQEADPGRDVRRSERRESGHRVGDPGAGAVQGTLDQRGLGGQRRVVDPGAAAGDLGRRERRRSRRSTRPPGSCCRCPCRRRSAGRRRRRSPRRRWRHRRPARAPSRPGSGRPRGRWRRTTAGSCTRSDLGRADRPGPRPPPRSSTRTDTSCCRARTLTPATPATKAPTMAAVTSRG